MAILNWIRGSVIIAVFYPFFALVAACASSENESSEDKSNSEEQGELPSNMGYCQDTCTKDCTDDNDCDMSEGEMCCDFGSYGKTCLPAYGCPRFCQDDSVCDSTVGEACLEIDIGTDEKICTEPEDAVHTCSSADDCDESEICCDIYKKSVCTRPSLCPAQCASSSECDTENDEICCTTVQLVEPNLKAKGLCLNPEYESCPKQCSQSTDCDTSFGELCCDGLCREHCVKRCEQSSDCRNQICCKSALMRLPAETEIFSAGPYCEGTPSRNCSSSNCGAVLGCEETSSGSCEQDYYRSCSDAYSESSCNDLPGCMFEGTGSCTGTSMSIPCSTIGSMSASMCESFPGCTYTSDEVCDSASYINDCFDMFTSDQCASLPGCTWNDSNGYCEGTPAACSSFTSETTCEASANCTWNTSGSCTGEPLACSSLTTREECQASVFCSWSSTGSCTGTPTACSSFTSSSACYTSDNCYWDGTAFCTGTPTPCSELSATKCLEQSGCDLVFY